MNRSVDYTTIPSAIATAAARGAPAKVIFFASAVPAEFIFDFSAAAEVAKEMAAKK